jgi:hypothetical protein
MKLATRKFAGLFAGKTVRRLRFIRRMASAMFLLSCVCAGQQGLSANITDPIECGEPYCNGPFEAAVQCTIDYQVLWGRYDFRYYTWCDVENGTWGDASAHEDAEAVCQGYNSNAWVVDWNCSDFWPFPNEPGAEGSFTCVWADMCSN